MKLTLVIRNDVHVLQKKYEANHPDGGAVIKAKNVQKSFLDHKRL